MVGMVLYEKVPGAAVAALAEQEMVVVLGSSR